MRQTSIQQLEDLEEAIVLGQRALAERNRLLVALADAGHTSASLFHRINDRRTEIGAPLLSRDAIEAAIRRGRSK
jgi:hypothetical protein